MDFELDGKRARVTSKGGNLNLERILWESGAARLLPRLIGRRRHGPVSLADRHPAPARTPAIAEVCPDTGRARRAVDAASAAPLPAHPSW